MVQKQLIQELASDVRIERSVPLEIQRDNGLLNLLSAMGAMLRRYDELQSLFAMRRALNLQHEGKYRSPQAKPGHGQELGSSPGNHLGTSEETIDYN